MKNQPFNVLRHRGWDAAPRDPITIGTAIAGAVGVTSTVGTFLIIGATAIATSLVTSWALRALAPKPPELSSFGGDTSSRGTLINQKDAISPHDFVYGQVRKGGVITYYEATGENNKFLHQIIVLAGHEVEEIGDIYINDEVVTVADDGGVIAPEKYVKDGNQTIVYDVYDQDGSLVSSGNTSTIPTTALELKDFWDSIELPTDTSFARALRSIGLNNALGLPNDYYVDIKSSSATSYIRIKRHLGAANQVADADLLAETENPDVDANFRGRGIAYIYVRYEYDQDVFANGLPLITAVVKGKKVYDPRTGSTAYSNNAALCVRDYIASSYGLSDDQIDDTVFSAAANICDENVSLSGSGTEKKYTINGITRADINYGDVLSDMMTACAGSLFWGAGKWKLTVGDYTAPTKTLTLDDLRGPISLATRINLRDQFNIVKGTFNNASDRWIVTDYPEVKGSTFVTEDGGQETALDLRLPYTTSSATAQRLAKLTLYRGREQMTFTADFGLNAFDVEVGEIIALTNDRYGWNEKEFECVGWSFGASQAGALTVSLTLRETSEAAFDWSAEEKALIQNNTTLLPFNQVPSLGISLSSGFTLSNEQLVNLINVSVSAGAFQLVDRVEVEFKKSSESTYRAIGSGQVGAYQIVGVDAGSTYDVRVRAINAFGVKGNFTTQSIFVSPVVLDVDNVTAFDAHVLDDQILLDWTPVDDQALSFFKIRHSIETTGATWADATTYIEKVSRPATSATGPAMSGTYMIRAFDKTGQPSANYSSVVVTDAFLREYTTTLTETDTTFSGTKTNTEIADADLRLTSASTSGEYELPNYIDIGSVKRARTYVKVETIRFNANGDTWDNMTGTWDTWVGTWDNWTGAAVQQADQNVEWYVATTDDDPAGTPTWSGWTRIKSATIKARAFKYKLVLKSQYAGVTPSISSIVAYVEHD